MVQISQIEMFYSSDNDEKQQQQLLLPQYRNTAGL